MMSGTDKCFPVRIAVAHARASRLHRLSGVRKGVGGRRVVLERVEVLHHRFQPNSTWDMATALLVPARRHTVPTCQPPPP